MEIDHLFHRLADDRSAEGPYQAGVQGVLGAVSPFYSGGASLNRFLYESGLRERRKLPVPVLSVGNITLGGTGKTPFVLWLVALLKREGRNPVVLTRGYGREDEDELVVVHDGRRVRAHTFDAGDEPVLLAKALGDVPVIACANRYRAGRYAIRKFGCDCAVLDDGFQHHRLQRQGDIVLVDATRKLSTLRVFPRGTLRESPEVLARAHLIVLTRWNQAEDGKKVAREVKRYAGGVPIVRADLVADDVESLSTGEAVPREERANSRAVILCGVGNPESVRASAREAGLRVLGFRRLSDHARLSRRQLQKVESWRKRRGADWVVITEKDAVKLREVSKLPAHFLVLRASLTMHRKRDESIARKTTLARLHARGIRGYLR